MKSILISTAEDPVLASKHFSETRINYKKYCCRFVWRNTVSLSLLSPALAYISWTYLHPNYLLAWYGGFREIWFWFLLTFIWKTFNIENVMNLFVFVNNSHRCIQTAIVIFSSPLFLHSPRRIPWALPALPSLFRGHRAEATLHISKRSISLPSIPYRLHDD